MDELPGPLAGIASAVTVLLPWGSLLQALFDPACLRAIRATACPGAGFEAVLSYDPARDEREWQRLGISVEAIEDGTLGRAFALAGWERFQCREMSMEGLAAVGTTWARRLAVSRTRRAWRVTAAVRRES